MAPPWKEIDDEELLKVPSRKPGKDGQGTLGDKIELYTNFFRVSFQDSDVTLYHFDIKIDDSFDQISAVPTQTGIVGAAPAPPKKKTTKKKKCKDRRTKNKPTEDEEGECAALSKLVGTSCGSEIQTYGKGNRELKRRIPKPKQRRIFAGFVKAHSDVFQDSKSEFCFMAYDGEANSVSSRKPSQFKKKKSEHYYFVFKDDQDQQTKTYRITFELVNQGKLKTLLHHMKESTHVSSMPNQFATLFQMIEIIFNYEKTLVFQSVMRNQFFSQDEPEPMFGKIFGLGGGKEGVRGFTCSLRPVQGFNGWKDPGKFMLNVDVAHAAFYCCQPLLEFLDKLEIWVDTSKRLSRDTVDKIEDLIVKNCIKVVTTHKPINYKHVVKRVSNETPLEGHFMWKKDGKEVEVNVAKYTYEKYGYMVKYPKMQCLEVGNKGELFPIEVCKIASNQRVKGRLSDEEMKQFVAQAVLRPNVRYQKIHEIIYKNQLKDDPYLKQLGVVVSENFEHVDGRVLPPPVVHMKGISSDVKPSGGVWDVRENEFYKSGALDRWAVINFTDNNCGLEKFIASIMRLGRDRGMKTTEPLTVIRDANLKDAADTLRLVKKEHPTVNFILCVKYNKETFFYNIIKTTGERDLGLATNCVLFKNVKSCNDAVVGNLLFKINAQLGGINHSSSYPTLPIFFEIFSEAIMVMGADVNHPPAGNGFTPSVVAVVGSTDQHATKYAVEVRAQQHRRDMIADVKTMTKNLLVQYYKATKTKPLRIVMFRDGVSESEFLTVLRLEMLAMRQACIEVQKDGLYKPAITFICVQKRHSTRMFCKDKEDENVPAGTVMDTVVVQSFADFYLCSHKGIKGTSKPAHYIVLWDDSDFSMDQLELLTNSLCYNYSRCSRAVSIPAPVYYAHLAAYRGKVHLAASQATHPEDWARATDEGENSSYSQKLAQAVNVDITSNLSQQPYYA